MITSRRDYILRILDEVNRLLARALLKRSEGREQEALQTVVAACERLFAMEANQLFQFTPDQHYAMLSEAEDPEVARNKVLIYAALNVEAGRAYQRMGNRLLAHATFANALQLTRQAYGHFSRERLPEYAPDPLEIVKALETVSPVGSSPEVR
ncbi:MAG: hypothetical protein RIQ93_1637 [Verrucomicrobiota bacterium]|jgi:hypothetical protein